MLNRTPEMEDAEQNAEAERIDQMTKEEMEDVFLADIEFVESLIEAEQMLHHEF